VVKRVSKKEVRKFIERQEKEIRSKLYPKPVMEEIHKVRKAMKSVVYLSEIENFVSEKTLAFYREMEEAIGDFHDQQVVLGLLSQGKLQDDTKRKLMLRECRASSAHIRKRAHRFYHS
jgi:CHAD domain-containing protein